MRATREKFHTTVASDKGFWEASRRYRDNFSDFTILIGTRCAEPHNHAISALPTFPVSDPS
jgi:hypothetical protein